MYNIILTLPLNKGSSFKRNLEKRYMGLMEEVGVGGGVVLKRKNVI